MGEYKNKTKSQYHKEWWSSDGGKAYKESSRLLRNEQHKKYRQSEKGKKVQLDKAKRMREKYPEKWSARQKLRYAVSKGIIKKLNCEVCGDKNVCAHHPDYSKPLEVIWLCMTHHREVHGNMH